jgi:dienelactone hydrolase
LPGIAIEQELELDYRMNEQIVQVPAGYDHRAMLETTVFRPNGPGPFPLLVINHGKDPGRPSAQPRDRFYHMATAFVKRGYAVMVPMRQGFANSTGRYRDRGCDMKANGYLQAEDIRSTLEFARPSPGSTAPTSWWPASRMAAWRRWRSAPRTCPACAA